MTGLSEPDNYLIRSLRRHLLCLVPPGVFAPGGTRRRLIRRIGSAFFLALCMTKHREHQWIVSENIVFFPKYKKMCILFFKYSRFKRKDIFRCKS